MTPQALTQYIEDLRTRANAALEDGAYVAGFTMTEIADELAALSASTTPALVA